MKRECDQNYGRARWHCPAMPMTLQSITILDAGGALPAAPLHPKGNPSPHIQPGVRIFPARLGSTKITAERKSRISKS